MVNFLPDKKSTQFRTQGILRTCCTLCTQSSRRKWPKEGEFGRCSEEPRLAFDDTLENAPNEVPQVTDSQALLPAVAKSPSGVIQGWCVTKTCCVVSDDSHFLVDQIGHADMHHCCAARLWSCSIQGFSCMKIPASK